MRQLYFAAAFVAMLVTACNLFGSTTPTSGELYASNASPQMVLIRTTEAGVYGSTTVFWTLDPIRGRVTALIKADGSASFEGLPPDSSAPLPPPGFQSTNDCVRPAST
jgi:hypothetical protein